MSLLRLLNNSAFHHLLNTPIDIDLLQHLSRGLNNLELLLSSPPYKTQSFSHSSSWFPHRLESEDHTMPWFCPKPSFPHPSSWFPHRLESEDHAMLWFCPKPSFLFALDLGFRGVRSSTKPLELSVRLTLPSVAPRLEA